MLSRAQIQHLAKQHGIKANLKTVEIEAELAALGIALLPSSLGDFPEEKKRTGLSLRTSNVSELEDFAGLEKKKVGPAVNKPRMSLTLVFDDHNNKENASVGGRPSQTRKSVVTSEEVPSEFRRVTRKSHEKMMQLKAMEESGQEAPEVRRVTRKSQEKLMHEKEARQQQQQQPSAAINHLLPTTSKPQLPKNTISNVPRLLRNLQNLSVSFKQQHDLLRAWKDLQQQRCQNLPVGLTEEETAILLFCE